ncbi:MAG: DUF1850 domain-containing protein [Bauldia sp.]|nr:DUF1850 domain-containing protein [Bauldia sp.]
MSLCIALGAKTLMLAGSVFTLSWTHSVEKTVWTETWSVTDAGLVAIEARIEGSGAGMEPPDGAVFDGAGWVYRPQLSPLPRLVLADSGAVGAWTLCSGDGCLALGGGGGPAIVLEPCAP